MMIGKTIDRGSKEKLYVQVYSIFLEKIESGEWPSGKKIPPEDDLCRMYDVSKVTVREAIQELVREGYLRRQQGKGTFVMNSFPHMGVVMRTTLSGDDIHGKEVSTRKEIMESGIRKTPEDVREFLKEEFVYYLKFKKVVEGETCDEEYFIPLVSLSGSGGELPDRSIYEFIEEKGTKKICRIIQIMDVAKVRKETSDILGMKEGSPASRISRVLIGSDGNPIAFTRLIGPGRRHRFQMEFERIK